MDDIPRKDALQRTVTLPLPPTRQDLKNSRIVKKLPNLNDIIDDLVDTVWEDPEYQELVYATNDGETVGGSLVVDDVLAAQYLFNYCKEHKIHLPPKTTIASIKWAHSVVLRRYNQSRKHRKVTVDDQVVPPEDNGGNTGSNTNFGDPE